MHGNIRQLGNMEKLQIGTADDISGAIWGCMGYTVLLLSLIHIFSCHIASTGKQYHSHAATIYKWAQEDAAKGKAAPKQGIPDYSCKEGESL